MGVVSACVSADALLDSAMGIAREIAGKSPLAVRAAKRSFNVTEEYATSGCLSLRAGANGCARFQRRYEGSAACLC